MTIVTDPVSDRAVHQDPQLPGGAGLSHDDDILLGRRRRSIAPPARSPTICRARIRSSPSRPRRHKMPLEAARGGAETMYPESSERMKKTMPNATMPAEPASGSGAPGLRQDLRRRQERPRGRRADEGARGARWRRRCRVRRGRVCSRDRPRRAKRRRGSVHVWRRWGAKRLHARRPRRQRDGQHRTDEGVLVVDTMTAQTAPDVVAAIRTVGQQPIRWIIDTHSHPDHTGGNATLAKSGAYVANGQYPRRRRRVDLAFESALMRLNGAAEAGRRAEPDGRPTASSSSRRTCSSTASRS